ncbi:DNA polymerase IV [Pelagibius litoralis]|uniref:DNA polymerase IV n=1 Tax=Pelagibius litoralis TaxID=374515 RepID=A0A967EZJ1_9PROT|nr:DNA polymerase IV [Pelagibius litoralis]
MCRDCLEVFGGPPSEDGPASGSSEPVRCLQCQSPRLIRHPELDSLAIAHIDCDAFYASVEKRDRPELSDKPVIVGGGRRGVVSAACYVARMYGVHSAMPMFKALKACPDAVVVRPDMAKYSAIGKEIRERMNALTPLVEPISIDEAFLDLTGTEVLHHGWPARSLAGLVRSIESDIGLTASIGLSFNKFLAKIASDLDKPRGFAVIGRGEARDFLAGQPVSIIWGVGKSLRATLARDGISMVRHLLPFEKAELVARYGRIGQRLYHFARAEDDRSVISQGKTKSISSETTFNTDISTAKGLLEPLWPLCEKVARRLKRASLAGGSVQLKLKTAEFKLISRSRRLPAATQMAEEIYRVAEPLLRQEADGRAFRLIGVGAADLVADDEADLPDLLDPERNKRVKIEMAMDQVRSKLGNESIVKGRALGARPVERRPSADETGSADRPLLKKN